MTFDEWFDQKYGQLDPNLRAVLGAFSREAWDAAMSTVVTMTETSPATTMSASPGMEPCCGAPAGQHKMGCAELRLS